MIEEYRHKVLLFCHGLPGKSCEVNGFTSLIGMLECTDRRAGWVPDRQILRGKHRATDSPFFPLKSILLPGCNNGFSDIRSRYLDMVSSLFSNVTNVFLIMPAGSGPESGAWATCAVWGRGFCERRLLIGSKPATMDCWACVSGSAAGGRCQRGWQVAAGWAGDLLQVPWLDES